MSRRSSGSGCSHLRLGRSQVAGHLVWLAASPCARLADGRAQGSGFGCPAWVAAASRVTPVVVLVADWLASGADRGGVGAEAQKPAGETRRAGRD